MKRDAITKIIALLPIPAEMVITYGIDSLLFYQRKCASTTFEYTSYYLMWFAAGLVLIAV